MENGSLQFQYGIHRNPSITGNDGELSECVNLIPKNGELANIKPTTVVDGTITTTNKLVAIHTLADLSVHYIYYNSSAGKLYNGNTEIATIKQNSTILKVIPMGNTLIVTDENGITYLRWEDNAYIPMFAKPDLNVSFGMSKTVLAKLYDNCVRLVTRSGRNTSSIYEKVLKVSGTATGSYQTILNGPFAPGSYSFAVDYVTSEGTTVDTYFKVHYSDGSSTELSRTSWNFVVPENLMLTKIETKDTAGVEYRITLLKGTDEGDATYSFRHDETYGEENYTSLVSAAAEFSSYCQNTEKRFIYPFFVRYAIKLFDGSYINISSPIFIAPNMGTIPLCIARTPGTSGELSDATMYAVGAKVNCNIQLSKEISKWKHIATGIDIAITPPIYKWDQGKGYNKNLNYVGVYDKSVDNLSDIYTIDNGKELFTDIFPTIMKDIGSYRVKLPCFTDEEFKENVLNASNFYIVKNVKMEDIIANATEDGNYYKYSIENILDNNLQLATLQTLPTMGDEFNSMNTFVPQATFVYNGRLSIANIKEVFKPSKGLISPSYYDATQSVGDTIFTYIKEDGKEFILKSSIPSSMRTVPTWFFYPHSDAYKMVLYQKVNSVYRRYEVELTEHPYLNGAYWFNNGESPTYTEVSSFTDTETTDPSIIRSNYIYTSNVNNPFHFPALLQETIGSGTIRAVSTSAKALSEGQFGEFPLYAFCSDGIWALSVQADGKYATTNPVCRDVVENVDSICQIDSAVVFGTAQGMKIIDGSEVRLFSQAMEGEDVDEDTFFTDLDTNHSGLKVVDTKGFVKVVEGCKVMFDYANQLLHIYQDKDATTGTYSLKHYVFSLLTNEWSSVVSTDSQMKAVVPGYPYSTLQNADGKLYQYTNNEDNTTLRQGVILTRPICFDGAFSAKCLTDLKMFYKKSQNSKCKIAIFVSNDCYNWHRVSSLHTGSFKWFRFRIQTSLTDLDGLTSLLALYDVRRTNKIR